MLRLINTPLAIHPDALAARREMARGVTAEQIAAWERDPARLAARAYLSENPNSLSDRVTVEDGVAVMKLHGGLSSTDDFWCSFFGDIPYASIARDLRILEEQRAHVLVDLSSPGGDAEGCAATTALLFEARSRLPSLRCYSGGKICSAGYSLASACGDVTIERSAIAGSIGVIIDFVDFSGMEEKLGIKSKTLRSSQSPAKRPDPMTADGEQRWQAVLDDLAAVFVADVARNRSVTEKIVLSRFGKGDVFVGEAAVSAGLVDRIGTREEVLAEMHASLTSNRRSIAARSRARASTETPMKCQNCGADPMECADCGEEAKADAAALDLPATATAAERRSKMRALIGAGRALLATTSAPTLDEALGALAEMKAAAAEAAALRQEKSNAERAKVQGQWSALLTDGAKSGVIEPGELLDLVPTFLEPDNQAAARAALGKVVQPSEGAKPDAARWSEQLASALATVPVTAAEVARLQGLVTARAGRRRLPASDVREKPVGAAGQLSEGARAAFGITPEMEAKYGNPSKEVRP